MNSAGVVSVTGQLLATLLLMRVSAFPQDSVEIDYETVRQDKVVTALRISGEITLDGNNRFKQDLTTMAALTFSS